MTTNRQCQTATKLSGNSWALWHCSTALWRSFGNLVRLLRFCKDFTKRYNFMTILLHCLIAPRRSREFLAFRGVCEPQKFHKNLLELFYRSCNSSRSSRVVCQYHKFSTTPWSLEYVRRSCQNVVQRLSSRVSVPESRHRTVSPWRCEVVKLWSCEAVWRCQNRRWPSRKACL